jgi:hypothetical protein
MERRNALREVKARLHQASFRDAVLSAYGGRCAISPLPEPRLLDAAHIVMDADEQLGQPVVSNGLPLTKVHHAARPPATSRGELKSAYSKLNQCSTNQLFQNILNNLLAITANNTR